MIPIVVRTREPGTPEVSLKVIPSLISNILAMHIYLFIALDDVADGCDPTAGEHVVQSE